MSNLGQAGQQFETDQTKMPNEHMELFYLWACCNILEKCSRVGSDSKSSK